MGERETRDELNRLYWESDESVTDIADRLGLSRRALYDELEPLPAGADCPECGGALGFRNRTAAEAGEAECADCGRESRVGEWTEPEPAVEQERRAAPLSPARRVPTSGNAAALGGALMTGLGIGAVAGYLIRRT